MIKLAWKDMHARKSALAMRNRRPIRELYNTTRTVTLARLLRPLLGSVAIVLMVTGRPSADDRSAEVDEYNLHQVQQATMDLQESLTPSERFPWLVPFAYVWGGGQPHRRAIAALSASRLPIASFALIEMADDPDSPLRLKALNALGMTPHIVALPVLLRALKEADPEIKTSATSSLILLARHGSIAPYFDEIVAQLVHLIEVDPDPRVRRVANSALPSFGMKGILTFFGRPPNPSPSVAEACRQIRLHSYFARNGSLPKRKALLRQLIAEVRRPTSSYLARVKALGERLPSDGPYPCTDPRSEAIAWLGAIRARASLNLLIEVAKKDSDPAMRAAAVSALGLLGGPSAEAVIIAALDDPNLAVRSRAVLAFDDFDDARQEKLVPQLAEYLLNDESTVLRARIAAKSTNLPGDWAALVPALADPSVVIRRAAEASLLERARAEEMTLLLQALEGDARLSTRAARILAAWPEAGVTEALIQILESGSPAARPPAALALGLRGDESAREPLERVAGSSPQRVAIASLQALQDLDRPASLDALRAIVTTTNDARIRDAANNAYVLVARSALTMKNAPAEPTSRARGSR